MRALIASCVCLAHVLGTVVVFFNLDTNVRLHHIDTIYVVVSVHHIQMSVISCLVSR